MRRPSRAVIALASCFTRQGIRRSVVDRFGNELMVLLPELLSLWIYAGEEYERDVVSFAKRVLRPGMTAFDVGAHIGMHTLLFGRLVADRGHVVAFEPLDHLYRVLGANAAGDERIRLEKLALADGRTPELALHYYGLRFSGWTTAHEPHAESALLRRMPAPKSVRVRATSLDAYTAEHGIDPDLIKLDIEGCEMAALRGARRVIGRAKPSIIMECGDTGRSEANVTSRCLELLERNGYEFFEFDSRRDRVRRHAPKSSYPGHSNLLCVPKAG